MNQQPKESQRGKLKGKETREKWLHFYRKQEQYARERGDIKEANNYASRIKIINERINEKK